MFLAAAPTWAVVYYFAVDVPAAPGGVEILPHHLAYGDSGGYMVALALPGGLTPAGLHQRPDGLWLLAPADPFESGGQQYETRDLLSYNGTAYALFLDGSAAGIPDYVRIDSVLVDPVGNLVLSFDVPVNLGGTEYSRSDLVRFVGGATFSLYWDAEVAGVPAYANVVGAGLDGAGALVVSFDVPTQVGGTSFLPGELVLWNGTSLTSYFVDASWPPYAQLRDFTFPPAAGSVPDGAGATAPLLVTRTAEGTLTLTWDGSCTAGDADYEVYEGRLGEFYSHTVKSCTTGGVATATVTPAAGNTYYLVVPRNSVREGSYGLRSNGSERPQGLSACLPQEIARNPCP